MFFMDKFSSQSIIFGAIKRRRMRRSIHAFVGRIRDTATKKTQQNQAIAQVVVSIDL